MQGETTGRKMTPKDVCNMTREKLEPYQYTEECPVHALFSCSEKYCQGTLQDSIAAESNNDHALQGDQEDCDGCNHQFVIFNP